MLVPVWFFYFWIQMIMPSFSTLLANPSRQILSNESPFLRAEFLHEFHQLFVLLIRPRTFASFKLISRILIAFQMDIGLLKGHFYNFINVDVAGGSDPGVVSFFEVFSDLLVFNFMWEFFEACLNNLFKKLVLWLWFFVLPFFLFPGTR